MTTPVEARFAGGEFCLPRQRHRAEWGAGQRGRLAEQVGCPSRTRTRGLGSPMRDTTRPRHSIRHAGPASWACQKGPGVTVGSQARHLSRPSRRRWRLLYLTAPHPAPRNRPRPVGSLPFQARDRGTPGQSRPHRHPPHRPLQHWSVPPPTPPAAIPNRGSPSGSSRSGRAPAPGRAAAPAAPASVRSRRGRRRLPGR